MASPTVVANLALGHLGVGIEIANLETENSPEANACRRFYDHVRKCVLRSFEWPDATRTAALALVTEDPDDEWLYAYRYPADCLFFRRIQSGTRNDTRDTLVPLTIVGASDGSKLIYTDREEAIGEYTFDFDVVDYFNPDFTDAMSWLLAYYAAPSITGGDPFKTKEEAYKGYLKSIAIAQTNARNEQKPDDAPPPDFIRARQ